MRQVIYALIPTALVGVYFFGIPALTVMLTAMISCVVVEAICQKIMGVPVSVKDGSAILTGLLLAMNLPSGAPWWMVVIGSVVAIVIGKQVFGGLGNNPFNPALVARAFLIASFGVEMTTWPKPDVFPKAIADTVTAATPLGLLKEGGADAIANIGMFDLIVGNVGGCIGEVSAIALLIGAGYLLATGIITWHVPVTYIATVGIFTGICYAVDPVAYANPWFHMFSGGLMLGALFMATDMVTSPISPKGKIIFGLGCGLLTSVIRLWGGYPEGVSYSILIMNAFVPLINRWTKPVKFGVVK